MKNGILVLLLGIMLNGCYKCPTGEIAASCEYSSYEDEQFQQAYERKLQKESKKNVNTGVNKSK